MRKTAGEAAGSICVGESIPVGLVFKVKEGRAMEGSRIIQANRRGKHKVVVEICV